MLNEIWIYHPVNQDYISLYLFEPVKNAKHSVLHQGHSGRTATHIKLRLKWLVSEGYTVIAPLFP